MSDAEPIHPVLGWLSAVENPFFLKEARTLGRRQFAVLGRLLVLMVAGFALPVAAMERAGASGWWSVAVLGLSLWLLALTHAVTCAFAGWQLGTRLFMAEHRQQTLESVRLISRSPWIWLPQKLVYPMFGLATVWLAALPVYLAVALRRHFEPAQLWPGMLLAGCAGLLAMCAAVSMPPEGPPRRSGSGTASLPGFGSGSGRLLYAGLVGTLIWNAEWQWVLGTVSTVVPRGLLAGVWFFNWRLSLQAEVLAALAVFGVAAVCNALAVADPADPRTRSLGRLGRAFLITLTYYGLVGSFWTTLQYRPLWLAGLPVAVLVIRWQRWGEARRQEDVSSAAETRRLDTWWDNPVWLRDLRVALRANSLRRQFAMGCILMLGGVVAAAAYSLVVERQSLPGNARELAALLVPRTGVMAMSFGPVLLLSSVTALGLRARLRWQDEQRFQTLPQLFSTPVPSVAIVRGRWAASALAGLTLLLPSLLVCGAGFYVVARDYPLSLGAYAAGLAYLLGLGAVLAALSAAEARPPWWLQLLVIGGMVAEFGVLFWLLVTTTMTLRGPGTWIKRESISPVIWVVTVMLLNLGAAVGFYVRSVAAIRAQRRRDFEG